MVYLGQQIQQFQQKGAQFAMQHLGTEDEMEQALRDLVASLPAEQRLAGLEPQALRDLVASLPPEQRLAGLNLRDVVASLPPEERLAGLSPRERVAGLSPKELLAGLSSEAKEALRKQLQGDAPPAPAE
jgi:hypothetical protein